MMMLMKDLLNFITLHIVSKILNKLNNLLNKMAKRI